MIDLYWVVFFNNAICFLACFTCFLHALHGGLYTTFVAKVMLFALGLGFYSGTLTEQQIIMPGYKYIMFVNAVVGFVCITYFLTEAYRSGCLSRWFSTIKNLLVGGTHVRQNRS